MEKYEALKTDRQNAITKGVFKTSTVFGFSKDANILLNTPNLKVQSNRLNTSSSKIIRCSNYTSREKCKSLSKDESRINIGINIKNEYINNNYRLFSGFENKSINKSITKLLKDKDKEINELKSKLQKAYEVIESISCEKLATINKTKSNEKSINPDKDLQVNSNLLNTISNAINNSKNLNFTIDHSHNTSNRMDSNEISSFAMPKKLNKGKILRNYSLRELKDIDMNISSASLHKAFRFSTNPLIASATCKNKSKNIKNDFNKITEKDDSISLHSKGNRSNNDTTTSKKFNDIISRSKRVFQTYESFLLKRVEK